MNFVCGSYQVISGGKFRDYTDLDKYVMHSETDGLLLGEDASDYVSFHAVEIYQPFTGVRFRIGMVLDYGRSTPIFCSVHNTTTLVIGMNKGVELVRLDKQSVGKRIVLDTGLQHILCNGNVLVAIHELGTRIVEVPEFTEIANVSCEIVASVTLSNKEVVLVSMTEETTRIALPAT